ncbi:MAG TPA: hypothetical protein VEK15_19610 [Vicinamibacteria bacterium]|nr:hypothetical protein [Vicinamibacteria bacterium]
MSHLPTEYLSARTGGLYAMLRGGKPSESTPPESNDGRDQAALEFLSRECSIDVLGRCVGRISDGDIVDYLLDQILVAASLLSSEAFTGIENIRKDLRLLGQNAIGKTSTADLRVSYDRRVERLGQHFFALGRRLHQLEHLMATCPMTGSGETLRGRYGQRVRDLAGDVRFMRQELGRWVRRFVPLGGGASASTRVDSEFIVGRIDAVVDELGLRIREVGETLSTVLVEQLILFDASITRKMLFRRDLENVLDIGQLLDGLANLFDRVKAFEAERKPEQLARVKALLAGFRPDEFLSFSGVRESQQRIFLAAIDDLKRYQASEVRFRQGEDPIQVFLLVTGDLIAHLRRRHRSPVV